MARRALRISGIVVNGVTGQRIADARVEVWDQEGLAAESLASTVTEADGSFQIAVAAARIRKMIRDREPKLFFKVFVDGQQVRSTEGAVQWHNQRRDERLIITVDPASASRNPKGQRSLAPYLIPLERDEEKRQEVTLEPAENPLINGTLGDVGLAIEVRGAPRFGRTLLVLPFDPQQLVGVDPASLHVFRLDEQLGNLRPVWDSGVNTGLRFVWARVQRPGRYVVLGLPRDRLLQQILRQLARARRLSDDESADAQHAITRRALEPLLDAPEDALDQLRELLMRLEIQTGPGAHLPGELKTGYGGHFVAFTLPGDDSLGQLRERLAALKTPPGGLPEEALFYPPSTAGSSQPPWPVTGTNLPWRGVDATVLKELTIWDGIKAPYLPWLLELVSWVLSPNWWMYQHDAAHTGHASGMSDIDSTSVSQMFTDTTVSVDGPIITKPCVVNGKVYVGTGRQGGGPGGTLYKINLMTGAIEGTFPTSGAAFYSWVQGIAGSPAIVGGRVYFTGLHGTVYCVDAASMTATNPHPAAIWSTSLKTSDQSKNQPINNPNADSWSSPLVVNGRVYVGCGEGESATTYGFIFCLDAATGHVIWVFCTCKFTTGAHNNPNTIPSAVAATWAAASGFAVPGNPLETGCAVWSSCAYDASLRRIYVGTGNSQLPHTAQPDEPYGSGLIALNADTGNFAGFFQPSVNDGYWPDEADIDVSGSPTTFSLGNQHVVAFGSKSGAFFVLDADTLAVVARRQLLPRLNGSGLPGDRGAAIQAVAPLPSHKENMYGVMATPALHRGLGRLFVGIGGYNGMALDTSNGIDPTRTPFLRAINWDDLHDAWPTATGSDGVTRYTTTKPPMYTSLEVGLSSPAVVNDVVFVSTNKVGLYALDAGDGHCLWSATGLPSDEFALGPAIYGNYVVLGAGSKLYIYRLGNTLIWPKIPELVVPWWEELFRRWPPPPPPPDPWEQVTDIAELLGPKR
jgi:outer membrane protein assembly factor BamB